MPDDYDESQDIIASGAWKPPGIIAAKARVAARVALAKAENAVANAQAEVVARESRHQKAESKVKSVNAQSGKPS